MEQPLITVIVPVYKVEAFLPRCVESIRNQTYQNLEIILVDDGSPDHSSEMCDGYAQKDPRIRVIHKENGGQSSARNAALDVMNGEYVGFVDSDDWIEPEMYSHLFDLITEHDAQIAVCGVQCDFSDGRKVYCNPNYPAAVDMEVFTTMDALREVTYAEKITNSLCDKLFQKAIFADIRMREGTVYEDFEIMPYCLERAKRIVYDPMPLYHYRMTDESTTRGRIKEKRFLEAEVSRELIQFYQNKYPQMLDYVKAQHVEICLNIIVGATGFSEFAGCRSALIREVRKTVSRSVFCAMRKKTKIKYLLFRLNADLFAKIMAAYYNR